MNSYVFMSARVKWSVLYVKLFKLRGGLWVLLIPFGYVYGKWKELR